MIEWLWKSTYLLMEIFPEATNDSKPKEIFFDPIPFNW